MINALCSIHSCTTPRGKREEQTFLIENVNLSINSQKDDCHLL